MLVQIGRMRRMEPRSLLAPLLLLVAFGAQLLLLLPLTTTAQASPRHAPHVSAADDVGAAGGTTAASRASPTVVVAGYLPDYRASIPHLNSTAEDLTDLILFSISPTAMGTIGVSKKPRPCCLFSSHFKLGREARAHKQLTVGGRDEDRLRLLVSVGGAGRSNNFPLIVSDQTRRHTLVRELFALCQQEDLDGVDFDWEQPKTHEELTNYAQLIADTYTTFQTNPYGNKKFLVTVALHATTAMPENFYQYVDRVHVMTYDMVGDPELAGRFHPSAYGTTVRVAEQWLQVGCPPSKLVLGIPAYGRNKDRGGEAMAYSDMIDAVLSGGEGDGTASSSPPLLETVDTYDGFVFDTPADVRKKVRWAIDRGVAGVFFWEVGQDKHYGGDRGDRVEKGLIESAALEAEAAASSSSQGREHGDGGKVQGASGTEEL